MRYNWNMIGHLKGTIIHQDLKTVILDVGGVGYKIHTNGAGLDSESKEVSFWTYLAVRENALDLYGFKTKEELDFFELLLTVSGIGPKSAMAILSVASPTTLKQAIASEDSSHLTKVSGIGKKNADKIVLELKGKIGDFVYDGVSSSLDDDAIEALKALGYSERDAREALKKVPSADEAGGSKNTEEKIRFALKNLNK